MPVPILDCPELDLLEEPLETTTVVSEDIWKKFDLDFPQSFSFDHYYAGTEDGSSPSDCYDRGGYNTCKEAREIRHHDCMWAGLCISKEHNRTLPAKKDPQMHRKVAAGRSLLINRKLPSSNAGCPRGKNLESDGDSTRPETPQSCESETDSEDELPPRFEHDSISINEKLGEYLGGDNHRFSSNGGCGTNPNNGTNGLPASEVTGQLVRRTPEKKRNSLNIEAERKRSEAPKPESIPTSLPWNRALPYQRVLTTTCTLPKTIPGRGLAVSLGDHCYHLNQTSSKKLDHLGVQTPSDSEEEIDVVTCDKSCGRPASLPTNPSAADRQHLQNTVTSALKERQSVPRPRGRPPSSGARKRTGAQSDAKPAKRPRHRNYQKRNSVVGKPLRRSLDRIGGSGGSGPASTSTALRRARPEKAERTDRERERERERSEERGETTVGAGGIDSEHRLESRAKSSSSDDEPDTEKRSLHNNMERQRRIELRNAFEDLRVLVPEVEAKEKAPKVVILRQAAVYCDALTELGQATISRVAELKRKQDRLRIRLSQLRRSFAAAR